MLRDDIPMHELTLDHAAYAVYCIRGCYREDLSFRYHPVRGDYSILRRLDLLRTANGEGFEGFLNPMHP